MFEDVSKTIEKKLAGLIQTLGDRDSNDRRRSWTGSDVVPRSRRRSPRAAPQLDDAIHSAAHRAGEELGALQLGAFWAVCLGKTGWKHV